MIVKLLTEHHLEFLSFKGGSTCSSESTLVKCHIVGNHMPRLIFNPSILSNLTTGHMQSKPAQHEKSLGLTCDRLVPLYSYSI